MKTKLKNFSVVSIFAINFFAFNTEIFFAEDDEINIAGQTLIISDEKWSDRNLNFIGRGTENILIYGGGQEGNLNNVTIDARTNFIYVFGGYYDGEVDKPEDVEKNIIIVTDGGGTLNSYVIAAENKIGAENPSENIFGNMINIFNSPDLLTAKLYGAAIFDDDTRERTPTFGTDNTLNVYTKNLEVGEVAGFNAYNFYLPDTITNSDIILNVTGERETDISSAKIFINNFMMFMNIFFVTFFNCQKNFFIL